MSSFVVAKLAELDYAAGVDKEQILIMKDQQPASTAI